MSKMRPCVLSVAGFDPSGGAGVLADVKTFEANKVYGLGAVSALTIQNDVSMQSVSWIDAEQIIGQVKVLAERYTFDAIKIGIIEKPETLLTLLDYLGNNHQTAPVVWDPVLQASSGYMFHKEFADGVLERICRRVFLATPNIPEAVTLGAGNTKGLASFCHVFLKGGHSETDPGRDLLLMKDGREFSFRPQVRIKYPKHGSGCVLSSAIAANLALGYPLHRACLRAKQYTAAFLSSNATLSGYHKI